MHCSWRPGKFFASVLVRVEEIGTITRFTVVLAEYKLFTVKQFVVSKPQSPTLHTHVHGLHRCSWI